jgi:hypothetical protein
MTCSPILTDWLTGSLSALDGFRALRECQSIHSCPAD